MECFVHSLETLSISPWTTCSKPLRTNLWSSFWFASCQDDRSYWPSWDPNGTNNTASQGTWLSVKLHVILLSSIIDHIYMHILWFRPYSGQACVIKGFTHIQCSNKKHTFLKLSYLDYQNTKKVSFYDYFYSLFFWPQIMLTGGKCDFVCQTVTLWFEKYVSHTKSVQFHTKCFLSIYTL